MGIYDVAITVHKTLVVRVEADDECEAELKVWEDYAGAVEEDLCTDPYDISTDEVDVCPRCGEPILSVYDNADGDSYLEYADGRCDCNRCTECGELMPEGWEGDEEDMLCDVCRPEED